VNRQLRNRAEQKPRASASRIERKNSATEQGVREAMKLKANSISGLESKGYALVGLVGDIACP